MGINLSGNPFDIFLVTFTEIKKPSTPVSVLILTMILLFRVTVTFPTALKSVRAKQKFEIICAVKTTLAVVSKNTFKSN